MMRRLAGSVLIFEAIVIVLAIPVAINVAGVDPAPALIVGLGLALAALVVAARVDRRGGVAAGWTIQGLVIASAPVVPVMLVLGAMFAGLWYAALRLVAATAARGQAPVDGAQAVDPRGSAATGGAAASAAPGTASAGPAGRALPGEQTTHESAPPAGGGG